MPTHMMNICVKFHWNPSTKYRDIALREIAVNRPIDGQRADGRTDGRPKNTMLPAHWKQRHKSFSCTVGISGVLSSEITKTRLKNCNQVIYMTCEQCVTFGLKMLTVMSLNNHYRFVHLTVPKVCMSFFYGQHYSTGCSIVVEITLIRFQLRHESTRLMASERAVKYPAKIV